jgi:hypothetical protein
MSKSLKVFLFILVVLLIFPAISLFRWTIEPKRPFQLMILNKTVPSLERHNHRSFHWVLNHEKYVKTNKKPYSYRNDYYGFVPLKPFRDRQYEIRRIRLDDIIDMANEYDAAYFIDTYGVYFNDWYQAKSSERRSRKIYGGLNNNDYLFLKEMSKRKKLIIAEYNFIGYPTNDLERNKVEDLFDMHWTGWTGKYFGSLNSNENKELPVWIVDLYKKQYDLPWEFKDGGIVLVNNQDEIVVLENKTHLDFEVPYIYTEKETMEEYHLPYQLSYTGWFDIVLPGQNRVLATYKLHTNEMGDSLLSTHFIPNEFPAVIQSPNGNPYFYFCGDFSNNMVNPLTAYFKNVENVADNIFFTDKPTDKREFFWCYYRPLISGIMYKYAPPVEK